MRTSTSSRRPAPIWKGMNPLELSSDQTHAIPVEPRRLDLRGARVTRPTATVQAAPLRVAVSLARIESHPARNGRHVCTGLRQSIPSSR